MSKGNWDNVLNLQPADKIETQHKDKEGNVYAVTVSCESRTDKGTKLVGRAKYSAIVNLDWFRAHATITDLADRNAKVRSNAQNKVRVPAKGKSQDTVNAALLAVYHGTVQGNVTPEQKELAKQYLILAGVAV